MSSASVVKSPTDLWQAPETLIDRRALADLVETLFRVAYATPSSFPLGVTLELHPVGHSPDANPDQLGWTDAVPRSGPEPG